MKKDVVGCKWFVEELYFGASQNCFQRVILNLLNKLIIVILFMFHVIMEIFLVHLRDTTTKYKTNNLLFYNISEIIYSISFINIQYQNVNLCHFNFPSHVFYHCL